MRKTPLKRSPMKKKGRSKPTAEQQRRHDAARDLGCINHLGTPCTIHHLRENLGMGQAVNHDEILPLCSKCHQSEAAGDISIHKKPIQFEELYGPVSDLVKKLDLLLNI